MCARSRNARMDPQIASIKVLGVNLTLFTRTQKILTNPMWDTLRDCTRFNLVVRSCSALNTRGNSKNGHVFVDAGIRTIGAAAWQSCQQLQIVGLPFSVVCIKEGAFQGCLAECCSLAMKGKPPLGSFLVHLKREPKGAKPSNALVWSLFALFLWTIVPWKARVAILPVRSHDVSCPSAKAVSGLPTSWTLDLSPPARAFTGILV